MRWKPSPGRARLQMVPCKIFVIRRRGNEFRVQSFDFGGVTQFLTLTETETRTIMFLDTHGPRLRLWSEQISSRSGWRRDRRVPSTPMGLPHDALEQIKAPAEVLVARSTKFIRLPLMRVAFQTNLAEARRAALFGHLTD